MATSYWKGNLFILMCVIVAMVFFAPVCQYMKIRDDFIEREKQIRQGIIHQKLDGKIVEREI